MDHSALTRGIEKARALCASLPFALLLFLLACLVTIFGWEVVGVGVFAGIICLLLILCEDITVTTLPFLLLCAFVTKCYDSYDTFIGYWRVGFLPIFALLFHFIVYRRPFKTGRTFWPLCAVAAAITLGGAFSLSFAEYFAPRAIFYVLSLGVGMVFLYLLMKSAFVHRKEYDVRARFAAVMTLMGLFACFMVLSHYLALLPAVLRGEKPAELNIQWQNNISTMLMLALPFPFYFAHKRHPAFAAFGFLFYLCTALTASRGGLLMGGIEFVVILLYFCIRDKKIAIASLILLLGLTLAGLCFYEGFPEIYNAFFSRILPSGDFISSDEPRMKMIKEAWKNFLEAPIFGKGFGYTGLTYQPVDGAGNWYHMYLCQVFASFGIVGCLAFGWQMFARLRLIFGRHSTMSITLGLSYLGLFLMSLVNPGEFCPLPYELLAVLIFILLELPVYTEDLDRAIFAPFPFSFPRREKHRHHEHHGHQEHHHEPHRDYHYASAEETKENDDASTR